MPARAKYMHHVVNSFALNGESKMYQFVLSLIILLIFQNNLVFRNFVSKF